MFFAVFEVTRNTREAMVGSTRTIEVKRGQYIARAETSLFIGSHGRGFGGPDGYRIKGRAPKSIRAYPIEIWSHLSPADPNETVGGETHLLVADKFFTVVHLVMPTDENYGTARAKLVPAFEERAKEVIHD